MFQNLDSEAKRERIYQYLEKALNVAFEKFTSNELGDSERLGWGRLVVQLVHETSALVRTDILEKNSEDIEMIKTVCRMRGDNI